ncbi:uncharacterized protein G2W53_038880 [Senna tora]|uniref:Uncharacterized protein n=1 Tax=Senna tora TaxID=362788 RepID=A0A834W7C5_9FABA|nr:uncharacterized protein G2W53_038880 [Senna tora]
MPGTILVSVLEFMGLLLSSSTSIKVSMGKTEYQISEKGDFSFPLTSLRDDFIVRLEDADGNEISPCLIKNSILLLEGFHSKSIVEKGVWEDIFSLGHGHLHLKLQFILNDEERDRIRRMRQSALKKKHDELLKNSHKGAESGSISDDNTALTFSTIDEIETKQMLGTKLRKVLNIRDQNGNFCHIYASVPVSPSSQEAPKKHLQQEAIPPLKSPFGFRNDEKSGTGNASRPDRMQLQPNSADQYKETSSNKPISQAIDVTKLQEKGLIKKPSFHSPSSKDPQRAINSKEGAILFRGSEKNDVAENNNRRKPNPSSVRKIVSAFERQTGLAQEMRSHIKPPPTEYQSSKIETKASPKTQHSGEDTEEEEENYKKDLIIIPSKEDKSRGNNGFRGSYDLCIQRDSPNKLSSVVLSSDDNYCNFESSGAWIFPGESRNFCITTGGKTVMALLEKNAAEKIDEVEESKPKNSDNIGDENSGRPVKQVIKVATIIGFGIFVLLTRQRKGRSFILSLSLFVLFKNKEEEEEDHDEGEEELKRRLSLDEERCEEARVRELEK